MTKITLEQQAILDEITDLHAEYKSALVRAKAIGRQAERDYIQGFLVKRDARVAEAVLRDGIAKRRVGREALQTTDARTVNDAVEHGKKFMGEKKQATAPVAAPQVAPMFQRIEDGLILVTLQPEDFEPYKAGFPDGTPDEQVEHLFTVTEHGTLQPVGFEKDETFLHPVVKVSMSSRFTEAFATFLNEGE